MSSPQGPRPATPPPTVRYFIACERVERVGNSRDYSLTRVIHTLWAPSFPRVLPELWFLALMSEGRGDVSVTIELWHCDDEPERRVGGPWTRKTPLSLGQNPLEVHTVPLMVRNVHLRGPVGTSFASSAMVLGSRRRPSTWR
jgi:hypothetical protein